MKFTRNPFILFLPFLVLYLLIVILFPTNGTSGDQGRYLYFAHNLIKGYFSPAIPNIDLGNGPGYPLILIPFVALHLPLLTITLLNAILYYLSIVFLYKTLIEFVSRRIAIIFALFWAFYINSYQNLPFILTEVFTSSLISFLVYFVMKAFKDSNPKRAKLSVFVSGFLIGYLALTKPIFGYVISFVLPVIFVCWITKTSSVSYRKSLYIMVIAFIITLPYLFYTYHLTNRMFYWSSVGGNNLYWMTSPSKNEYGSWISYPVDSKNDFIPESKSLIDSLHKKDFAKLPNYKGLQQDDILKKIAFHNITSHPIKFIENCLSNVGRIFFNFPFSYKVQTPTTLIRLPVTGTLLVLIIFCFFPTFLNWKKIDYPIRFLLFIAAVYFGGSILGSAETRMFTIIVPILLTWIAVILSKSVKIKLKFKD